MPQIKLSVEPLADRTVPAAGLTAVGSAPGAAAVVTVFNPDATTRFELRPFPADFTGGVTVAVADFNADGTPDVAAGTGPGIANRVVVFSGTDKAVLFDAAPFEASFRGGVNVSAGDVTGDGRADLIVSPDQGGGPPVTVYSGAGFAVVADFFGIDDPNFRGGGRTAVGDVNADGTSDLVVAAGFGGGPRVAVFDGTTLVGRTPTRLVSDFFAFEQGLRNGAYVAAGDLDGDGRADLVFGGGPGGGPRVTALSGSQVLAGGATTAAASPLANFFAGNQADRNGVRVAVGGGQILTSAVGGQVKAFTVGGETVSAPAVGAVGGFVSSAPAVVSLAGGGGTADDDDDTDAVSSLTRVLTALVDEARADAQHLAKTVRAIERNGLTYAGTALYDDWTVLNAAADTGSYIDFMSAAIELHNDVIAEANAAYYAYAVYGIDSRVMLLFEDYQDAIAEVAGDYQGMITFLNYLTRNQYTQIADSTYQQQQQIAESQSRYTYLSNLNNLASYDWGGDTSLAARATAGIAPVGINRLMDQAGVRLTIPGLNAPLH